MTDVRTAEHDLGERLLRSREVLEKVGISETTLYRWIAKDKFPAPRLYGDNCSRWKLSDVDAWIENSGKKDAA